MEKKQETKKENGRLIIDGNAFYELDLDCVKKKEQERGARDGRQRKGQRK